MCKWKSGAKKTIIMMKTNMSKQTIERKAELNKNTRVIIKNDEICILQKADWDNWEQARFVNVDLNKLIEIIG